MTVESIINDKSKSWTLFDKRVSKHYDLLSKVISLGLYGGWRKKLADELPEGNDLQILDLATGTGAIPLSIMKNCGDRVGKITGVDMSQEMLNIFGETLASSPHANTIRFQRGDATDLPFEGNEFDAVTMACGIRNVADPEKGCQEILRMLKPGGKVLFLEPSMPNNAILRKIYLLHFRYVVPAVAAIISDFGAYKYFNQSVEKFMYGQDFLNYLTEQGFEDCHSFSLTFGSGRLYVAFKPQAASK